MRTKRKPGFELGERVADTHGRVGVIVAKWGSLQGCLECGNLVEKLVPNGLSRRGESLYLTPCCQRRVFRADCTAIVDVRWEDGELRAVNVCWLKLSPLVVTAARFTVNAEAERLLAKTMGRAA